MTYTRDDPKWVQAEEVTQETAGYVTVKAYGETFKNCRVGWNNPYLDRSKSDVLVQNSRGDWLRVWFYDADIQVQAVDRP
jgi:hypothetical protein